MAYQEKTCLGTLFQINTDGSGFHNILTFTGTGGAYPGCLPYGDPFLGSFNTFLTEVESSAVYPPTGAPFTFSGLDDIRGAWGVDVENDTVWAVLDQSGGVFAVDPGRQASDLLGGSLLAAPAPSLVNVPEPGTLVLLGTFGLCLAAFAWRRRRVL